MAQMKEPAFPGIALGTRPTRTAAAGSLAGLMSRRLQSLLVLPPKGFRSGLVDPVLEMACRHTARDTHQDQEDAFRGQALGCGPFQQWSTAR
jgi:hypothetical protein